jgi:hypothetical protein
VKTALAAALFSAATVALTGCGSRTSVKVQGGVIHIGRDVPMSSLRESVLGIKVGTAEAVVRSRVGKPWREQHVRGEDCWVYRAEQSDSAVDALVFCMSPRRRVKRILTGVHG